MTTEPINVLIFYDEEGIVDYLHRILDLKGYQTFTAMDSSKAMELFKEERPEICVLDIHLAYSPLDGVQVLAEMKKMNSKAECIMVTRITDEDKMKEAKRLGAVDYLLKPVDTKDLIALVNKVAERIEERKSTGGQSPR